MSLRRLMKQLLTRPVRVAPIPRLDLQHLEERWVPDATVNGTAGADLFRVARGPTAGTVLVSSDNNSFAPVVLIPEQLTGTLSLNTGDGADTVTIENLGSRFTGNVVVTDTDAVTLNSVTLAGSLTVNGVTIAVADGATVSSSGGDVTLKASDTYSATYPRLIDPFSNRQAASGITVGAATVTARNVTMTSFASTDRLAKTDVTQDTRAVTLVDVNGDGRADLITAATDPGTGGGLGGPLLLFLNTGDPLDPFRNSIPQTITRGGGMTSLAVGDVTGDGKPDLVVGSTANPDLPGTAIPTRLFVNTGLTDAPFRYDPNFGPSNAVTFPVGNGKDLTTSVALADVNGDGKLDLVTGNRAVVSPANGFVGSPTRLYLNQGGANPFAGVGVTVGAATDNTQAVAFADLNGDGRTDLITANVSWSPFGIAVQNLSRVYLNTGVPSSLFSDAKSVTLAGTDVLATRGIAVGDLNTDGQLDIVLGVDGKASQVYLSKSGTPAHLATPVALGANDAVKGVAIADVNRDGKPDVVTAVTGVSRVYLNQGTGDTFTPWDVGADKAETPSVAALAMADLTGDGNVDLALVGANTPPTVYVNDGASRPYIDATAKLVSLDPTLTKNVSPGFLNGFSILASSVVAKADASVVVNGGATLKATAGNVVLDSKSIASAQNNTYGTFVGVTYAEATPTATAKLMPGATVSAAGGVFQLTAQTNAIVDASVLTLTPTVINVDIAIGKSRSAATATVGAGATVSAKSARVTANAINDLNTSAGGMNFSIGGQKGSGGLGIAVGDYESTATAQVDGALTLTDAAAENLVEAKATNVKNTTAASASVLNVSRTLRSLGKTVGGVSDATKAAASGGALVTLGGGLAGLGTLLSLFTGGEDNQFAAAAGIAWVNSRLTANAGVSGRVTAYGGLTVRGETEDNVRVTATGSAGNADTVSVGGGLGVASLTNVANATVGANADLLVGGRLHVVSNAILPNPINAGIAPGIRFVPPADTTGTPTSNDADRIANGYQMGRATADGFFSYIGDTVWPLITGILGGNSSAIGSTTWVKGSASVEESESNNSVGIGGGVNVFRLTNNSLATIGKGARVNQRRLPANVSTANQDVWVEADTTVITIHLSNQASLSNLTGLGAGAAGGTAVGGQFEYVEYNTVADASIDDGAVVSAARDLQVTANTFNYLLTVTQAGANAKSVGAGGTVTFHVISNTTRAHVEDGATLAAGRDFQVLAGNQLQVFNAGGGITQGSKAGVGVSVAANVVQKNDTLAFVGDANGVVGAGAITAGRNMDVKATADTVAVSVAISGAVAKGTPQTSSPPSGPDAFGGDFVAYAKALVNGATSNAFAQMNPKGGVGVSGDAALNLLASNTLAYVRGPATVTVTGDLTVAAKDTSLFASAAGAVAVSNGDALAGSAAINILGRTTKAELLGNTRVTAGSVSVTAEAVETPVNVTAGAGLAKNDDAVAGSVNTAIVNSTVAANVNLSQTLTTRAPSSAIETGVNVRASRQSTAYSVAGVVAGSLGSSAVGLAVDVAVLTGRVDATLGGAVNTAGDVRVFANDSQTAFGVAAGLAAAVSDGVGAAGSLSFGLVNQSATAKILPSANVSATGSVRVDADAKLYNFRLAGGIGGGQDAGFGGGVTVNVVPDRTVRAEISDGARVTTQGTGSGVADPQGLTPATRGTVVDARATDNLLLFGAAGAAGGKLGFAASVLVNQLTNGVTEARVGVGTRITSGSIGTADVQRVAVNAEQSTLGLSVAGSVAGGKTVGFGGAVVVEKFERNVKATVDRSAVVTGREVTVDARVALTATAVAGAISGSGDLAVSGSVVSQTLTTTTLAAVNDAATVNAGAARVWADATTVATPVAGVIVGSGSAGFGASVVNVLETDRTQAQLGTNARVVTSQTGSLTAPTGRRNADGSLIQTAVDGLAVVATAREKLVPVTAGGVGAGKAALAGSVTVTTLDLTTDATIGTGSVLTTPLRLIAADDTTVTGGAGAAAIGGYVGFGAGVDVQLITKRTRATVASSSTAVTRIVPTGLGDVAVQAFSSGTQLSVAAAAGVGAGAVGIAGGANGIRVDNTTTASVGASAVITSQSNVVVTAEDTSSVTSVAGALGAGKYVGVGGAVGAVVSTKDTQATIGAGAKVTANANGFLTSVSDGGFVAGTPEPLGGTFDPSADVVPATIANTIWLPGHQFTAGAGQAVVYRAGTGAADIGLVDGQTYYVIVVDANRVRLATTAALAQAGTSDVRLQASATAGKLSSLVPAGKGLIDFGGSPDAASRVPAILARRSLTPSQRLTTGVAVTAVNLNRVESFSAAGGGAIVGLAAGATADVITSNASATVGDSATVTANNLGSVLVRSGNEVFHLGAGGAAGIGLVGGAAGVHVPVLKLNTTAAVGNSVAVTAGSNIEVAANASEDVLSTALGLAAGAGALGGSVSVVSVTSSTSATTGANSKVFAGGNVGVTAADDSRTAVITGAGAIGALGGLGGAVGVTYVEKTTTAALGANSQARGDGVNGVFLAPIDGTQPATNGFATKRGQGVVVQAASSQDLLAAGVAGASGVFGSFAGAVTVATVKANTTADIGDGAVLNAAPSVAGRSVSPFQDVSVVAADATRTFGAGGAVGAGGIGGLAGGVDVAVVNPNVQARVGKIAQVIAARDVTVAALSTKDVTSGAISAAAGAVGVAGAVSVVSVGSGVSADGQRSLQSNSGNGTTAGGYIDDVARAKDVTGVLGRYVAPGSSSDGEKQAAGVLSGLNASIQGASPSGKATTAFATTDGGVVRGVVSVGATITAGRDVTVAGRDAVETRQTTGAVAGGLVAFGGAVGIATVADLVEVQMDGTVSAAGDVTVAAEYDSDLGGEALAGKGSANGVTVGLVGIGAQVTRATDNTSATTSLSGAVRSADTLTVDAVRTRTLAAQAQGVTAGGVAVGVAQAKADAGGSNSVTVTGQIGQGGTVNELKVTAESLTKTTSKAKATVGGVITGLGADASSTVQSRASGDGVFLTGAAITVAADVTVNGTVEQSADVAANGDVVIGAVSIGVSQATATTIPNAVVRLTGTAVTAGRDVALTASAQGQSVTNGTASGKQGVDNSAVTARPTVLATAKATTQSSAPGTPTVVTAGRNLSVEATEGMSVGGTADGFANSALINNGSLTAQGQQTGQAFTDIQSGTVLTAGTDLAVRATEGAATVGGSLIAGGVAATGVRSDANASLVHAGDVVVTLGNARLTAGNLLAVGARSNPAVATTSEAIQGYLSQSTTSTTAYTAVVLGDAALSARVVDVASTANVLVTNHATGRNSIFGGGIRQYDTVVPIGGVFSFDAFTVKTTNLRVTATAGATANGSTTVSTTLPRTTFDELAKTEDVSLFGKINLSSAAGPGARYVRRADGSADPTNTLTPLSVTDTAITFGDIAGSTAKPTAAFDAGAGTIGGGAIITVDGMTLSGVTITNLDASKPRAVVLGGIDLSPTAVDTSGITYTGGSVREYAVQTNGGAVPTTATVRVSNEIAGGDIQLTKAVVNPIGRTSLSASGSVTATTPIGVVIAGDADSLDVFLNATNGSINVPVRLSHGAAAVVNGPANPPAQLIAFAGGNLQLAVTGVQYVSGVVSPTTLFTNTSVTARSTGSGFVRVNLDSVGYNPVSGVERPIRGAYDTTLSAANGDVIVFAGRFGTDQRNAITAANISAPNGTVVVDGAAQLRDDVTGATSITARQLTVTAGAVGGRNNPLNTQVGTLTAVVNGLVTAPPAADGAVAGGLFVANTGPLALAGVNAGSDVSVTSTGATTVGGNLSAGAGATVGTITVTALDSAGTGNDLTVQAGANVSANQGTVVFQAGDNVTIDAGARVTGTTRTVQLLADIDDIDTGDNSVLTFLGTVATAGNTSVLLGGLPSSTSTTRSFLVEPVVTPTAVPGTRVVVTGTAARDIVTLRRADVPTSVNTGSGNDLVRVWADGGQPGATASTINAAVSVFTAFDTRVDYSAGGLSTDSTGTLRRNSLTGAGMGPSGSLTFNALRELRLQLGSGADRLTVFDTPAGQTVPSVPAITRIDLGGGNDALEVVRSSGPLFVNGNTGDDFINLGQQGTSAGNAFNLVAGADVQGGGGSDTLLMVSDSITTPLAVTVTPTSVTGLAGAAVGYAGIANLILALGSGNDIVTVTGTPVGTDLLVFGNGGTDQLTLDASARTAPVTASVDASGITGMTGGRVGTVNVEAVALRLTAQADELTFTSTDPGAAYTVFAGAGDDLVFGAAATSQLSMTGEDGNDLLIGGSANDVILGGVGDDILIGRGGSDSLLGGDGDDLLVGGSTVFDQDRTALTAIRAEWLRTDIDTATKVTHLRGTLPGGLNGVYTLTTATVFDDAASDTLTGGAGMDWFFFRLRSDRLLDFQAGEFTN